MCVNIDQARNDEPFRGERLDVVRRADVCQPTINDIDVVDVAIRQDRAPHVH